jgi:hypothetical protein
VMSMGCGRMGTRNFTESKHPIDLKKCRFRSISFAGPCSTLVSSLQRRESTNCTNCTSKWDPRMANETQGERTGVFLVLLVMSIFLLASVLRIRRGVDYLGKERTERFFLRTFAHSGEIVVGILFFIMFIIVAWLLISSFILI